ncbi:TNT domain-containing protein [Streptosporangium subroseum]|uniref:TNT domain-containing protein n=1 Tax=Streptosporangium subroseum TaxID=106412 RepID=UPI003426C1F4
MRHFRRHAPLAAAIGIVTAAFTGVAAQAGTGPPQISGPPGASCQHAPGSEALGAAACTDTIARPQAAEADGKPSKPVCGPPYLDDDPNLGPRYLPEDGILGKILRDYEPLNGVAPQNFLDRYWDEATNMWRYPPDYGFAHSGGYSNGKPLVRAVTLPVGTDLDRFGGEKGFFVSPLGSSYVGRALPPSNLNTFPAAPKYICSYHTYKVIKEFKVDGGPAVAAFQQEGEGRQYHLVSKYIPDAPQMSPEVSVEWLVGNGYLKPSN